MIAEKKKQVIFNEETTQSNNELRKDSSSMANKQNLLFYFSQDTNVANLKFIDTEIDQSLANSVLYRTPF